VINERENTKCQDLVSAINQRTILNLTYPADYVDKTYAKLPLVSCVQGLDQFDCMNKIFTDKADLMQLETGLSYTAGQYYNMLPLAAEKYVAGTGDEGLSFYAVAIARKDRPWINYKTLNKTRACIPGVGQAAGWIYPVSTLMDNGDMMIAECNVPVKSAANFFGDTCAPDALARYYNPFGNNPVTVCNNCKGKVPERCTVNDPYADYRGAYDCVASGDGDVAFVRHTTIAQAIAFGNTTLTADDFELLCLDGTRASIDQAATCNWGQIAAHIVMTSAVRDMQVRSDYSNLLKLLSMDFGVGGPSHHLFQIFESLKYQRENVMFTDETKQLKLVSTIAGGSRDTYYTWAGEDLRKRLIVLNSCPTSQARWCVISPYEMKKCENMIMAFAAKSLKPDLNCIMGDSVLDCLNKIRVGDADLITLDAADVYTAGKLYGLVPIASEDYSGADEYGDYDKYLAVAVARRADSYLTLFNMKQRRSCHSAVMSAAGWIIPVDKLIETGQIFVTDCNAYLAVSQYFSKSCVPGVLHDHYNSHGTNPVNLCEACGTGGPDRCQRNDEELYYGSSGAFRCLTEHGGDISFVRHTTVRENTDGRNLADWSRNRRSDDYELLCNDGTRANIDDWSKCNLGTLPSNAVMTAGFKTQDERTIFWTMLNFAQQFFDADTNQDFPMFDSILNHKDLIFQDATVRLVEVKPEHQTYDAYLGAGFIRAMERHEGVDCVTGGSGMIHASLGVIMACLSVLFTQW
jgi:melanoma-associated antigen p97